ncbi:MAG: hypothetical protein ACLTHV_10245 [Parasutterella excrementihominis]
MNKFTVSRRGLLSAGVAASAASLASSVFAQEKKSSLVPDKWINDRSARCRFRCRSCRSSFRKDKGKSYRD